MVGSSQGRVEAASLGLATGGQEGWMVHRFVILCILGFMVVLSTTGCTARTGGSVMVEDAWARPGLAGGMSAAYFIIHNTTQQSDVLVGVAGPVASVIQLHRSVMDTNGIMKMEHTDVVEIPARSSVSFEPGGLHVMLVDLQQDLRGGQQFDLTLTFQNYGDMTIPVEVKEEG